MSKNEEKLMEKLMSLQDRYIELLESDLQFRKEQVERYEEILSKVFSHSNGNDGNEA